MVWGWKAEVGAYLEEKTEWHAGGEGIVVKE